MHLLICKPFQYLVLRECFTPQSQQVILLVGTSPDAVFDPGINDKDQRTLAVMWRRPDDIKNERLKDAPFDIDWRFKASSYPFRTPR